MRELGKRSTLLWSACCLLLTAGCSTPNTPAPPPSSAQPAPIQNPLDLSQYREKPCDALPDIVGAQLKLGSRKQYKDERVLPTSNTVQPACELYEPPDETPSLMIVLFPAVRPIPVLQALTPTPPDIRPMSVHGYPAAVWQIGNKDPNAVTTCTAYVDLADNQGLGAVYHVPPYRNMDACGPAQQAAELVVSHLAR